MPPPPSTRKNNNTPDQYITADNRETNINLFQRPEYEYGIIQHVIILVHIALTQVRQACDRLHLKPDLLEDLLRQVGHLLLKSLAFHLKLLFWPQPSSTWQEDFDYERLSNTL